MPRATPDWLLITTVAYPSARARETASAAPGINTTSSGSPRYSLPTISVLSRSKKIAGRFIDSGLWEGGLDRSTRKQFSPLRARSTRRKRIRFRCLCELRVLRGEKYLQRVAARRNLSTLDPKLNITAHSTTAHPVFSTGT